MDAVGSFLMDQLLKMQWLSDLIAIFIDALGLDASSRWGGTLHFFIYDTIKIVILLCVMIFIISYIQSYFPPERSRKNWSRPGRWMDVQMLRVPAYWSAKATRSSQQTGTGGGRRMV